MAKYSWIYLVLLFLLNIDISIETSLSCNGEAKNSAKECSKLFSKEEQEESLCCFVIGTFNGEDIRECQEFPKLNKEKSEAIDFYEQELENDGYTNVQVECKSYYLQMSLLFLILILL